MDTRKTVEELLGRIAQGDFESLAELYAPAVDWKLSWPDADHTATVPWIRPRSTPDGIVEHFRLLTEQHTPETDEVTADAVLVDGADAVVLGEIRRTARPTGRSYTAAFALHLTVEDGRITRQHIYEDSLSVHQAFATT